jgi:hypothetical protein
LDLVTYVVKRVPELSRERFNYEQYPRTGLDISNFPLVRPIAVLADASGGPVATFPAKPTHVVIAPTVVRQTADGKGPVVIQLVPGTQVRLVETAGGWVLIARDGKRLGFIEAKALLTLQ